MNDKRVRPGSLTHRPSQRTNRSTQQNGNERSHDTRAPEPATDKQVNFLLNIGKRQGFTTPQLEGRIAAILGRRCGVFDLSKQDAGIVLDALASQGK